MKCVWMISPVPFYPSDAGNRIRILRLLHALKTLGYDVMFIHIEEETGDREAMATFLGEGHFFRIAGKRSNQPAAFIRRNVKRFTDRLPARVLKSGFYLQNRLDDYCDPALRGAVAAIMKGKQADVMIVEYVFMSLLFTAMPRIRKVLDTHDLFTDRYKPYSKRGHPYRWYSVPRTEECRGFARADSLMAIQEEEGRVMERMVDPACVHVVGHLTDIDPLPAENPYGIAFAASGNDINLQSINIFIRDVLPVVAGRYPQTKLYLAGSICKGKLVEHPAIVKLGFVDDLRTVYKLAAVVVNPALFGTGLKIKSIEAMGFGKVLIASPDGAMGLDDDQGNRFLIANCPEDYIALLCRLFSDSELVQRISEKAVGYAETCNRVVLASLEKIMETPS